MISLRQYISPPTHQAQYTFGFQVQPSSLQTPPARFSLSVSITSLMLFEYCVHFFEHGEANEQSIEGLR